MGWEDCGMYWAWRGESKPSTTSPTKKRLSYAHLFYDGLPMIKICDGVYDDGVFRALNSKEIHWHIEHGAIVKAAALMED